MNILKGFLFASAFVLLYQMGDLQAKKINFTEICHWQEGKGLYKKLSIPEKAKAAHLANHDDIEVPASGDCNVQAYRVFALAYIDVDQNGAYDANEDVLISKLEDTNGDDTFSVGDTLYQGHYPLNFDPCPGGVCTDIGSFNLSQYSLSQSDVDGLASKQGESVRFSTPTELIYVWNVNEIEKSFSIGNNDLANPITIFFANYLSQFGDLVRALDPVNTVVDITFPEIRTEINGVDSYFINLELDNPEFGEDQPQTPY